MLKSMIAGITALSLATATPAAAQGLNREDVGKLLIGLAAVAVIGAAIENNNDNDDATRVHDNNWSGINRNNDWSRLNQNSTNNRHQTLPSACLRSIETRFGTQRLYGQHCLQQNYRYVNNLPERCEVRIFSSNGPRDGFDPVCLRARGFTSDRRN